MEAKAKEYLNHGMRRSLSHSKETNEFAYENYNIRITALGEDTTLSVTNELGNSLITFKENTTIKGIVLGYGVVGDYLTIFTKDANLGGNQDYIYRINTVNNEWHLIEVYNGTLNFQLTNPIETLASYENEDIQKIYWVDGINQPRFINVSDFGLGRLDTSNNDTQFDFVPTISSYPTITVDKTYGAGLFHSGVIQYYVTYYNKFGAQSKIVASTDLNYITLSDRGGKPDEEINCSFVLTIDNVDTSFDYLRVYSAKRNSLNGPLEVQIVQDVSLNESSTTITVTDNNYNQEAVDSSILLFLGGTSFIASTLDQKDETLFLGNLTLSSQKNSEIYDELRDIISNNYIFPRPTGLQEAALISFQYKEISDAVINTDYSEYYLQTNKSSTTFKTFKCGEIYRFALQLQSKTGEWLAPIWIGDKKNPLSPSFIPNKSPQILRVPTANLVRPNSYQTEVYSRFLQLLQYYSQYRLLIAETNINTRQVIAQGLVCPTMFNYSDRFNNNPYSIASWINRPRNSGVPYEHMSTLSINEDDNAELQCVTDIKAPIYDDGNSPEGGYSHLVIRYCLNENKGGGSNSYTFFYGVYKSSVLDPNSMTSSNTILVDTEVRNITGYSWENVYHQISYTFSWTYNSNFFLEEFPTYQHFADKVAVYATKEKFKTLKESIQSELEDIFPQDLSLSLVVANYINAGTSSDAESRTSDFYIDSSVITLHSPEINDTTYQIISNNPLQFRIVGIAPITSSYKDYILQCADTGINGKGQIIPKTYDSLLNLNPLVSDYLYRDQLWYNEEGESSYYPSGWADYKMYLWHKTGSIAFQDEDCFETTTPTESYKPTVSVLQHKIFATLGFSDTTRYFATARDMPISTPTIFNSDVDTIVNLSLDAKNLYYSGNYDKLVIPNGEYPLQVMTKLSGFDQRVSTDPIRIKYKSTPHVVCGFKATNNTIPILPRLNNNEPEFDLIKTYELDDLTEDKLIYPWNGLLTTSVVIKYSQASLGIEWRNLNSSAQYPYNYIGELYRELDPATIYGGTSQEALEKLNWIPISQAVDINSSVNNQILISNTEGDTYYQRYDCLKTYPYTEEDENSVVDVVSIMLESHINLDGRCDTNRGPSRLLYNRPTNFNQFNDVYNQENNIFQYNILDEKFNLNQFPTQITWSLTKQVAADIDNWTQITMSNVLDFDGTCGAITKIKKWTNHLLVFQDRGISEIMYNNQVAVATNIGVPIEITNSNKVTGKNYISTIIGCTNKWSIVEAQSGLYFIDDYNQNINVFREGLTNLSDSLYFDTWIKQHSCLEQWNPALMTNCRGFYDTLTKDIYYINKDYCLGYNEKINQFTSFYSYNNSPMMVNISNKAVCFRDNTLWEQHTGEFNKFFGKYEDYYIEYKINDNPYNEKIFTNIQYIASNTPNIHNGEFRSEDETSITNSFDTLEVWNEYQYGKSQLKNIKDLPSTLKKKFRVWRAFIPRDENDPRRLNRIRNPWINLRLTKHVSDETPDTSMMEFHDLVVTYYM